MQLAINILEETPSALRLAAQFLFDHATLREAMDGGAGMPPAPAANLTPAPPVPPHAAPPPPVLHPDLPPMPPLAPAAPPADVAALPSTPNASAPAAPPTVDEFDKSGVPFDERIHQKSRNQKKDGTWKIKKGLADGIVETVMRELAPRIFKGTPSTPPAGASAPVSLPPVQPINEAPPPPPPALEGQAAAAPPPPASQAATPQAVDPFRALVAKITKARNEGKLTAEEVVQAVTAAGCPSLQLLNNMPNLIPNVEGNVDAILAMR